MNASSGSGLWPIRISGMRAPHEQDCDAGQDSPGSAPGVRRERSRLVAVVEQIEAARAGFPGSGGETHAEIARLDGLDDRVHVPRRLHLDPGPTEVRVAMGIVRGDLRQRELV